MTRDPIDALRRALEATGRLSADGYAEIVERSLAAVAGAIAFAEASPVPDPATATDGVTGIPFDVRGPA